MKLDVYVGPRLVGLLEQVDLASYVFSYLPDVPDELCVSLLMPPSVKTVWESRFLHPVFQVSLPEGMLRHVLTRMHAKQFSSFGDIEMLSCIGQHLIGRMKVVPHGLAPSSDGTQDSLQDLLQEGTDEMLEHLLQARAPVSGVSGGFRKFLAKSPSTGRAKHENQHATLAFDQWIVKTGDEDHPGLVFNEFHSMMVAREMGLPVPEVHVSQDFSRLLVRRFDIDDRGRQKGFEDMCALNGFNASDKFSGSVERVIKTLQTVCAPSKVKPSLEQFYAQYLACMVLRNGDAHLKNFGLLYTNAHDAQIAPVYDMVTMGVYAPRAQSGDALDEPALSLNGVRRWPDEKALHYLGGRCEITGVVREHAHVRLAKAVQSVARKMATAVQDGTTSQAAALTAQRMVELWSRGMQMLNPQVAHELATLASTITPPTPPVVRDQERG